MTLAERVAQLEAQQAQQTRALRLLVEGRWSGEMPHAAAEVVALMGGTAPPDFAPLEYPRPIPAQPAPAQPPLSLVDVRGRLPTRAGAFYSSRDLAGINGIDLHYTASPSTTAVEAIARYQSGPGAQEAFPAIAYTLIVDGSGVPHLCHDLGVRVWHNGAPGANTRRVGICYIGNTEPSDAQRTGLATAIAWVQRSLGRTLAVAGHKDSYSTSCPGPTWPTWRADVLARVP